LFLVLFVFAYETEQKLILSRKSNNTKTKSSQVSVVV